MRQFIFIFEDGTIRHGSMDEIPEDDLQNCRDGLLEIIDITDSTAPIDLYDNEFIEQI
jgi:hypothetical protein